MNTVDMSSEECRAAVKRDVEGDGDGLASLSVAKRMKRRARPFYVCVCL